MPPIGRRVCYRLHNGATLVGSRKPTAKVEPANDTLKRPAAVIVLLRAAYTWKYNLPETAASLSSPTLTAINETAIATMFVRHLLTQNSVLCTLLLPWDLLTNYLIVLSILMKSLIV